MASHANSDVTLSPPALPTASPAHRQPRLPTLLPSRVHHASEGQEPCGGLQGQLASCSSASGPSTAHAGEFTPIPPINYAPRDLLHTSILISSKSCQVIPSGG